MSMKPTYEQLEQQLAVAISERDAAVNAERIWEKSMMEACGEDGPASVASEIAALRALRDTALESLRQQLAAVVADNAGLKSVLEEIINAAEPEYHEQGMGCGVEDRGYQRDGYSACSYGWYSAIDRIYSEVIPGALPETPATDTYLAEVRAQQHAETLNDLVRHIDKSIDIGSLKTPWELSSEIVDYVNQQLHSEFAAQLRQGGEHE